MEKELISDKKVMTFDQMEDLRKRMLFLEYALSKYGYKNNLAEHSKLMFRLALYYDSDEAIGMDCERFLLAHADIIERFDREAL